MKALTTILLLCLTTLLAADTSAQCDTIASICEKHITNAYISDGQFYRALLFEDETAEFNMTLFGGTTYRMAGCSGLTDGNLMFTVYDKERNLLFSNKEHATGPFWDLVVANTLDVIIEANLDTSKAGSGCAVILVGFKR